MDKVRISLVPRYDDRGPRVPPVYIDMVVVASDYDFIHLVVVTGFRRSTDVNMFVVPRDDDLAVVTRNKRAFMNVDAVMVPCDHNLVVIVTVMTGSGFRGPMDVNVVVIPCDYDFVVIVVVARRGRTVDVDVVVVAFDDDAVVLIVAVLIVHVDVVIVALDKYTAVIVVRRSSNPAERTLVYVNVVVVASHDDLIVVVVVVVMSPGDPAGMKVLSTDK